MPSSGGPKVVRTPNNARFHCKCFRRCGPLERIHPLRFCCASISNINRNIFFWRIGFRKGISHNPRTDRALTVPSRNLTQNSYKFCTQLFYRFVFGADGSCTSIQNIFLHIDVANQVATLSHILPPKPYTLTFHVSISTSNFHDLWFKLRQRSRRKVRHWVLLRVPLTLLWHKIVSGAISRCWFFSHNPVKHPSTTTLSFADANFVERSRSHTATLVLHSNLHFLPQTHPSTNKT